MPFNVAVTQLCWDCLYVLYIANIALDFYRASRQANLTAIAAVHNHLKQLYAAFRKKSSGKQSDQ
jgi:hypothetical protein